MIVASLNACFQRTSTYFAGCFSCLWDRLVWPSGYGVCLESGRSWVWILFVPGFLRGRVIPVTSKSALRWLPCQAPGIVGSVLGLVSLVSVYCDEVVWKVWSATSISVWQYVKLSRSVPEIHWHVAGTLSNQQTNFSSTKLVEKPEKENDRRSLFFCRQARSSLR